MGDGVRAGDILRLTATEAVEVLHCGSCLNEWEWVGPAAEVLKNEA